MSPRPSRRAVLAAMIIGLVLHTVTVLAVWKTWGAFGRGNVLAWIDFPSSLAYLHLDGSPMLLWSLLLGGLQWGVITALLTWFLGLTVRDREEEAG
ncbi:MAG: hypothetical protein ACJ75H_06220 [Thermoanaerobaculia bacterium]